ncbi:hypothetical protein [Nonomuraea gerenzanensis]|uniref:Dienelactone hydrolase and related enzymes n=1 Tax=Nonomuraea gerenzanensis TaxID=93944 RepID=A0A1M4EF52_9ACTN|nr:hypothetical protein [Nonomuraea gerenzanensis]UBU09154.1 hypothetical protein LCN96_32835 [Nonomuraea gerenzanensis]SBO97545.1 Dienelactone hydrolase and related enzymes [Nonomuraea gerenzanensis]
MHTPDLFAGRTFAGLDDGLAHAEKIGFDKLLEQGVRTPDTLPNEMVYAGCSLGVMSAQTLAQTRPGARGALLFEACLPASEWPDDAKVVLSSDPEGNTFTPLGSISPHVHCLASPSGCDNEVVNKPRPEQRARHAALAAVRKG